MKKATSTFAVDNGTVYDGQVLTDDHPVVARYPDNFEDAADPNEPKGGQPTPSGPQGVQVDEPAADGEHGLTIDGAGGVTQSTVPAAPADQQSDTESVDTAAGDGTGSPAS